MKVHIRMADVSDRGTDFMKLINAAMKPDVGLPPEDEVLASPGPTSGCRRVGVEAPD